MRFSSVGVTVQAAHAAATAIAAAPTLATVQHGESTVHPTRYLTDCPQRSEAGTDGSAIRDGAPLGSTPPSAVIPWSEAGRRSKGYSRTTRQLWGIWPARFAEIDWDRPRGSHGPRPEDQVDHGQHEREVVLGRGGLRRVVPTAIATPFELTDFEARCVSLRAKGVQFETEAKKQPWGWWPEVLDSEGNALGLHAEV